MSTSATPDFDRLKQPILVLGAGVVGLTAALKIQLQGRYNVLILSEVLPTDPKTIKYCSQWAGGHHVYSQKKRGNLLHELEEATFDVMWKLSEPGSEAEECFLRLPQTEYFFENAPPMETLESMPNYRFVPEAELIPGAKYGVVYDTVTFECPVYLNYLFTKFLNAGGCVLRGSVQHINVAIEGGGKIFPGGAALGPCAEPPAAIINCTGLGARSLGGVEDKNMFPLRGQTLLVRAPWVRFGRTIYEDHTGARTYIIPRRSGDVVVGGTRGRDDWFPKPRPEISEDILHRALDLCPELAPPEIRAVRKPTVEDVRPLIVAEGCGLRPARDGGVRLETEWTSGVGGRGRVPIIHNYGHGGAGFQASWGSASVALQLLERALSPKASL